MKSSTKTVVMSFVSVFAALPSVPALSQQQDVQLEEIIVSARRVNEVITDVPISMTVYDQEQLSKQNVSTSEDLALYTPSLGVNTQFGSNNTSFALRGFVQDIGTQPTVGVYFADVVSPRAGLTATPGGDGAGPGSFFDLQNIQVIKGPQGTLFGRNTTGGSILLVPQEPTSEFEGYIEVSTGNYDMKRTQAVVNIPLESARLRLGIDDHRRDGHVKNTGTSNAPSKFNDLDYTAYRASLVLELSDDIENHTIATYTDSDITGSVSSLYNCDPNQPFGPLSCGQLERQSGDDFYTVQTSYDEVNDQLKTWQFINHTTWDASDSITVKNIISYGELKQRYINPLFGANLNSADLNGTPVGNIINTFRGRPLPDASIDFFGVKDNPGLPYAHQSTFTEEFRLSGDGFDERLEWQAGLYFELSKPKETTGTFSTQLSDCDENLNCTNSIGAAAIQRSGQTNRFENRGIYAQGDYDISDELTFTLGLRYTQDKIEAFNNKDELLYPVFADSHQPSNGRRCIIGELPECISEYKADFSEPTWLLGFDYKPTIDTLFYSKYARGYRSGGVNGQVPETLAVYQPEEVDSYEFGYKAALRGAISGTFAIAAFYNDFTDQQLIISYETPTGSFIPTTLNTGESEIYGSEVELSLQLTEGLTLSVSYAYLKSEVKQIVDELPAAEGYTPNGTVAVGDAMSFTPENKMTMLLDYILPLDPALGEISIGAGFTYTDEQQSNFTVRDDNGNLTGASFLEERELLDLNASWKEMFGSAFDLSLFATNITDEEYMTYSQVFSNTGFGADFRQLGQPRMVGARLRYSY